ncbi:disease resistance protein RUN1-like [Arachis stenosperma]|uniref:disease resistance protein RUN1-like n=1 Tax=Arachis stenosperma TaxID=217475 RepID=UPI0025AD78C2|nr:disease resistance protein RUN1-like [Arachis stenosperma]XP_057751337.1 disease resistance protein RUN1-like [Arachis stenosperma]
MECKSIQSMASSSTRPKYDVFVSFRGEDVRNTFADHLFAAFRKNGIVAFRDDRNLMQGQHISTELVQAIEGSQVLIVIFSKNYATSSWCLQELAKMLDCSNTITEPNLLPIFYDVSPSEVRKQTGDYGKALAEHEERFKDNSKMVQQWRESLLQVSNLSGWDIQNKQENGEIEKIVKRVRSKLGCNSVSMDGLVGMQSRVEKLENLIDFKSDNEVRVVGVCGMGGIGKSTLARVVYGRNLHKFGAHCFVDDISKVFRGVGLLSLQKQLVCQITNGEIQDIYNHYEANSLIKTMLRCQKALIVLDNADDVEQLENLGVTRDCLCPGSRIVVTSRDQHVLNTFGLDETYKVQLLNEDEAHQLFCEKAFNDNIIMSCDEISREYKKLTDLALKYAQGLPLAIKVLGSYLRGRDISVWRSALDRLKDNPKKEIADVLQLSFDGLEPLEKEIFLDIACFFNHQYKWSVKDKLYCRGLHPNIGISVLIDKSLITINERDNIRMHDLLQELGRRIVRQSAPNEPWKWSRIWRKEDFQRIMFGNTVIDDIKAVQLMEQNDEINMTLRAETLSRMRRLEFLKINNVSFSGSFNSISSELRYLKWKYYPYTYFPSCCKLSKLLKLVLQGSNMKQLWDGTMCLDNLKELNLSDSENLVKTPNLSQAPNLERLFLRRCRKLKRIHPSTGDLTKLVQLDLRECTSLMSFPITVFGISSLKYVNLRGCSRLFGGKELENGSESGIQCQSTVWSTFKRLKLRLPFHFFNSSKSRYNHVLHLGMLSMARLSCVYYLDLSYCNLHTIPEAIASLHYLEVLVFVENNIVRVPDFINKLPRLRMLVLDNCGRLMYVDEFPLPLPYPAAERTKLVKWIELRMLHCPKIAEKERLSGMGSSWMREYIKVHNESINRLAIVIPGSGGPIPRWFKDQNKGADNSMWIESFPNANDNNWIGISLCAEIVVQFAPRLSIYLFFLDPTGKANLVHYVHSFGKEKVVRGELVQLCLFYFPRQLLIRDGKQHDLDGSRFEFKEVNHRYVEVKKWGMRVVLNQDLE